MKNAGMTGAVALVGIGLITIGLSNFQSTPQAVAAAPVAAAVEQGPEEPTIVWYGTTTSVDVSGSPAQRELLLRAWSDGTVEARLFTTDQSCEPPLPCSDWGVIASPTDGMNAAADINFDEIVDGADLALLLGKWGDAPRNPMPPSDCPLGLLNPS